MKEEKGELQAFYFPHDIGASNDPKLIALRMAFGWRGIGMYWAIIEALHKERTGTLPAHLISTMILDFFSQEEVRTSSHQIENAKEYEEALYANALLVKDSSIATSERVQKNLQERKKRSEKARQSAEVRWKKSVEKSHNIAKKEDNANAMLHSNANAMLKRKGKERKEKEIKESSRRFTPPSLEEVTNYCSERKNAVDPETFIAFYESKGWLIGKSPMKNWKAAVHTWEKRETVAKPLNPALYE